MPSTLHHLADAAATQALGRNLAAHWLAISCGEGGGEGGGGGSADPTAMAAPILLLQGDLGAGKTCLVQGLAEGLGISEPITSPTFALAQHYSGLLQAGPLAGRSTALVHLDLYRLDDPAAAEELFAQEEEEARALGALMAVEWPERLQVPTLGAWSVALELADPEQPEAGRSARVTTPATNPANRS